ncbi:hypothetical protein [Streptomyces sp. NPDC017890]|uniref:hypothetical protein n=1 Tax=Streptomyces sp. NPDC017890 TaxID=3365015 RepID=UPI0037B3FC36
MAVMSETARWLKELGRSEPRDDSTANREMRLRSLLQDNVGEVVCGIEAGRITTRW